MDADKDHDMTETLASILNRTTSLLPNALLASFGMPRGDENLGDAKRACEDIIFLCSDPIYSPLRLRVERVHSHAIFLLSGEHSFRSQI
jgi:hypothetical protein